MLGLFKELVEPLFFEDEKNIAILKIRNDKLTFDNVTTRLQDDEDVARAAYEHCSHYFTYVSDRLKNDKAFVLEFLSKYGYCLDYVSEQLKDDEEVVLTAIKHSLSALKHASERLRNDQQFIEEIILSYAIKNYYSPISFFEYLGDTLKNNKSFVLNTAKRSYITLQQVGKLLQHDKEIILLTIKKEADFMFLPSSLKNDNFILLTLLEAGHDYLFTYLNEHFKTNKAALLHLLASNSHIFHQLDNSLKEDRIFIQSCLAINGLLLEYCSYKFKDNINLVKTAIKQNPLSYQYASYRVQSHLPTVLSALKKNGRCIQYIPIKLKNDNTLLIALKTYSEAFIYSHYHGTMDLLSKEFFNISIQNKYLSFSMFRHINDTFWTDPASIKQSISINGAFIQFLPEQYKNDFEMALLAVSQNAKAFPHLSFPMMCNDDIIFAALQKDTSIYQYIPYTIQRLVDQNDPIMYFNNKILRKKLEAQLHEVKKTGSKHKI